MARILFASTGEKGHTNPLAGVVQHLLDRGHEIAWLAIPDGTEQMRRLGVSILEPLARMPRPGFVTGGEELVKLVRNEELLRGWLRGLLLDGVPLQIEVVRKALREWRPDAVATDPMLYQIILASHLEGIPFGCLSSSLNPITPEDLDAAHLANVRSHARERDTLFSSHGLIPRFRVCDFLAPTFTTVFTTPEYAGDVEIPSGVHLVGPSLPVRARGDEVPFPWEGLASDRPVVYASFGSQISYQPEAFGKLARASEPLGITLVLTAGTLAERDFGPHVLARSYVPQLQLLPHVSAMVTHGGANSVMEALSFGVPLLISPVCNDQPLQAFFLTRSGAGLHLDLDTASIPEIRSALLELLDPESPYRKGAVEIQKSYQRRNGAGEAARLIEGLAGRENRDW